MSFEIAHTGNISTTERGQSRTPVVVRTIYVRNDGDNANDGLTALTALATLPAAASKIWNGPRGRLHQVMDVSGYVATIEAFQFQTPEGSYNGFEFGRPGAFSDGKLDIFTTAFEMRADPLLVQAITITGELAHGKSNHLVLTVSETLVVDAHVGQWVDGGILVVGVIHSNTANTITIATDGSGFSANANIYTQSCVLSSDDWSLIDLNCGGSVVMTGIKVVNTNQGFDTTAVRYIVHSNIQFYFCYLDGVTSIREEATAGLAEFWYCYITTRFWPEQHAHTVIGCVLEGCSLNFHGSGGGGLNALASSILDGCDAYGGANLENNVDVEVNNNYFLNAPGHAVHIRTPYHAKVANNLINDSGLDAIHISCGGGYKHIEGNEGTGQGGRGLTMTAGCQVHNNGGNTVRGTNNEEVKVGANAVSLWSDGESSDRDAVSPHFCRIFNILSAG